MTGDIYQAIADPTRRQIISMLAEKPLHINAVAEQFDISRPAISRHVKILTECGLINITKTGRERYCEANFERLSEVAAFLEQYRKFWQSKLGALAFMIDNTKTK